MKSKRKTAVKSHFSCGKWQVENVQIPFRFFGNEVAVSHPEGLEKTKEVALRSETNYIEG